jgi:hypothetical protein
MRPLSKKDLRPRSELSPAYFRATMPRRDRASFRRVWKRALASSTYRFTATFSDAWRLDLADLRGRRQPGRGVGALGDPHPRHFAFVQTPEGPRYVFDRPETREPGPAVQEALRHFTGADLLGLSTEARRELLRLYVAITRDRDYPRRLPLHLEPDLASASREALLRWTDGSRFRTAALELELDPRWRADPRLEALLRLEAEVGAEVVEVARPGSAPDAPPLRAWALLRGADAALELWSLAEVSGRRGPDTPLSGGLPVALRRETGRAEIDLEAASPQDRFAVLAAQASILAVAHRGAYSADEAAGLEDWLDGSVRFLRRRCVAIHARLKR